MVRILFSVEGQTEERFVKDVLYNYFLDRNIFVQPILLRQHPRSNSQSRGGIRSFQQLIDENIRLLNGNTFVTTMYDRYGLPDDFPSVNNNLSVTELENQMQSRIGDRRFIPYLQLHEFESLVLSDIQIAANILQIPITSFNSLRHLSPEEINTTRENHPSARLSQICIENNLRYNKLVDGPNIVRETGITRLMDRCPHFASWIRRLEDLHN